MLKEERLDFILKRLETSPVVRLGELSAYLHVSEDTIRRDIETLDRNGLCQKIRGGAIPHSPNLKRHAFKDRIHSSEAQKEAIARKALTLLYPGCTILLDGGTTTYTLATLLPVDMPVTVITNSIPVVNALMEHPLAEVILAGGRIYQRSQVTTGLDAIRMLEQVRVDICFTGVCSIHHEIGMTSAVHEENEVKRAMVRSAASLVAVTTHDKIGTAETFKVCDISAIDTIITEVNPGNDLFAPYKNMNIQIL